MKFAPFFKQVRAAHALSIAMADGTKPDVESLKALGLSHEIATRFKR